MSNPDGKRSASDVGDLLEESPAKRVKYVEDSKLTTEQLEALRRRAEGLDDIEAPDDEVEEIEPKAKGGRGGGGRNNRNKEVEEEGATERAQGPADPSERSGPKHNYAVLFGFLGEGYQGLQRFALKFMHRPISFLSWQPADSRLTALYFPGIRMPKLLNLCWRMPYSR
jgi:hypothetical protein